LVSVRGAWLCKSCSGCICSLTAAWMQQVRPRPHARVPDAAHAGANTRGDVGKPVRHDVPNEVLLPVVAELDREVLMVQVLQLPRPQLRHARLLRGGFMLPRPPLLRALLRWLVRPVSVLSQTRLLLRRNASLKPIFRLSIVGPARGDLAVLPSPLFHVLKSHLRQLDLLRDKFVKSTSPTRRLLSAGRPNSDVMTYDAPGLRRDRLSIPLGPGLVRHRASRPAASSLPGGC
jgi:hypothetical protein